MMQLGMDVARLNFSHGTHPEHARNIARLRRAAKQENRTICILQDLQGPKIRTGRLKDSEPVLHQDQFSSHHHASRYPRHPHPDLNYISGTGAGSAAGLAHSAVRRSDRTAGDAGAGQRCGMRSGQRRHAGRASGHQPAGSGAVDSRAYQPKTAPILSLG